MTDILIFAAGGLTAVFISWLVEPIIDGLIRGMNGETSKRRRRPK